MSTNTISARVDKGTVNELTQLAEATDRPKSWHVEQALRNYLDLHAWQLEHIRKSMKEADAGKLIPHEVVMRKLDRKIKAAKRRSK